MYMQRLNPGRPFSRHSRHPSHLSSGRLSGGRASARAAAAAAATAAAATAKLMQQQQQQQQQQDGAAPVVRGQDGAEEVQSRQTATAQPPPSEMLDSACLSPATYHSSRGSCIGATLSQTA
eukprot:1139852-Pelagomonas_calceolata.AAC.12